MNGQRVFTGEISSVHGNDIELTGEDGKKIQFSYEQVKKARLTIE
jgi:ribosome maturation factor RimP